MNNMLDEFKSIPGVVGGYVLHPRDGVLANNLPSFFNEPRLLEIGKKLQKIWAAGRMSFPDASEASLFYDESVLVLHPLAEQLFLVLICEPSISTNMLSMSINLALEELDSLAAAPAVAPGLVAPGLVAPGPAAPPSGAIDPAEVLAGPLGRVLESLQGTLAGIMGPMAQLIFEEALERWCATGQASREELPGLLEIIVREIGDPAKGDHFAVLAGPRIEANA